MFGWLKPKAAEARQGVIDAGAIFAREFGRAENIYGLTAPELASVLQTPINSNELRREARYLARVCPYLGEFLRITTRAVLPGAMEPLNKLPPEVVAWWREYWGGTVAVGGLSGLDFEAQCWRSYCTDGELFIGRTADGLLESISPDEVENEATGGDDQSPYAVAWKVRGRTVMADRIHHISNRTDIEDVRGRSMLAHALPASRSRLGISINSGNGAVIMARLVGILLAGGAGGAGMVAAAGGLGTSGLDGGESTADAGTTAAKQFPPGSLPIFPAGTSLEAVKYGMPTNVAAQLDGLVDEIAAGLGVSRHALDGDVSKANFSSLQAGFARDENTFADWNEKWCRSFRLPIWRTSIVGAIAEGDLSAGAVAIEPEWKPPYRRAPMAEKEIAALIAAGEAGLIDLAKEKTRRDVAANPETVDDE